MRKKRWIFGLVVVLLGLWLVRVWYVNQGYPHRTEIVERKMPFTFQYHGVEATLQQVKTTKKKENGQEDYVVHATFSMRSNNSELTSGLKVANALLSLQHGTESYGIIQYGGDDHLENISEERFMLEPGVPKTIEVDYEVRISNEVGARLFFVRRLSGYEDLYFNKWKEGVVYSEIIPIEEGL